jgi:phosphoserine aminotransferase
MLRFIALSLLARAASAAERAHNFGAGPAALPEEVLKRAQAEFLDFEGSGMSILEWTNLDQFSGTHPGVAAPGHKLQEMFLATERKLRAALEVPADYRVIFQHGGAVGQFAAVPMNLLGGEGAAADYIDQGLWSRRAKAEASKYSDRVRTVATYVGDGPPPWAAWEAAASADATYMHVCLSETVEGVELKSDPPRGWRGPPVVLDATSTILSRPIDVGAYALIYASGGKNIPHGMAVVLVRESLLAATAMQSITPAVLSYRDSAGGLMPKVRLSTVWEHRAMVAAP